MRGYAVEHPGYGLEVHKGYGTASHMAAIARLGPSPIHRLTFAPLRHMFPERAEKARGGPLAPAVVKGAAGGAKKRRKAA